MSSKAEKRGWVPRLRFPEFREAGGWKVRELGPLATKVGSGITPTGGDKNYTTEGRPFVRSQNVGWGELILNDVAFLDEETHQSFNSTEIKVSDVLLNITGASIGRSAVADSRIVGGNVNQHVCIIRAKQDELNPSLLNQFLISDFGQKQIDSFQAGGNRQGLNFAQIRSFTIPVPPTRIEQRKIADCLASLDERITLETQKLDTLKTHKKGLMQQLFPAAGETLPKLRFPEFQNAGEWEEKPLSQLGELISGLTYSPDDVRDEGLLVLRSSNVQNGMIALDDNVYVRADIKGANPSKPNDILICVRNGSKSFIGKNALIPEGMPLCTHGAFMTIFRSKSAKFIAQLFQTEAYEKQVSADLGATINSINGNQLKKYKFFVPEKAEQQKIASCLASLDDLITAQTQQLAALKTHKKGLMQQLFPSISET